MKDLNKPVNISRRFCVAPMMDWTDRHCRYFLRLLSKHALLYTEMVSTGALLHGDTDRHLRFDAAELPLALQLGGCNPEELARCSKLAENYGYSEVNLNVGCPSDRVQNHKIGACLMAEPALVADCIHAMRDATALPVTIKCRTGIDDLDSFDYLQNFVETVANRGNCTTFIIHARIALLQGLSPKENREIPPLNYERVYQIKQRFPELEIIINGGLKTLDECAEQLHRVDGVMIGREAYQHPWLLHDVDQRLFGAPADTRSRADILSELYPYIEEQLAQGASLHHMTRHVLGLFHGQKGGKQFRRHLSEQAHKANAQLFTLQQAVMYTAQQQTQYEDSHL